MKIKRRRIWLFLIILLYSAWSVSPVFAHALLVRSNPASNAVLQQPPVQVELFFSEPVDGTLSSINVYNTAGGEVDVGDVRVDPSDPTRMTVSLHSLGDGVYTVTWKAVSAVDGHQTLGTYPFAIGNANANAVSAIPQSTSFRLPFSALISKFLMLASLALLLGQRLFIALVWDPALKGNQNVQGTSIAKPEIWSTLYRVGLIGLLLSIGLGILAQAGQSTGNELGFPWNLEMGRMLIESRLGFIWLSRLGLAMFAVWIASRKESLWKDWGGFVVNLALIFTVTLTSHAATEAQPFLPILADWVHLLGMTFWLGGLVYLFTGIRQLQQLDDQRRTRVTSLLTRGFSANALIAVAVIGITGLYSAYLRVGDPSALLTSLYGHVLLVKQGFVAGLLLIAATNLLVISPRLNRERLQGTGNSRLVSAFGKILAMELTFAGLLLASVSFLTYIPPAKIAAPPRTDFEGVKHSNDLTVEMAISPARVGQNDFMLVLVTSNGQPVSTAKEVLLRFTPSQANIPPSELQLIGDRSGMYMAKGAHLSMPGKWQVQAIVRRQDKFDVYTNFDLTLGGLASGNESASLPRQAGVLILCLGLLCALLAASSAAKPALRWGFVIPATILLVGLGLFTIARPITVNNEQANPIPPNQESIAAGNAIYAVRCVPCHGVAGKGDGPLGVVLNPRPADLSKHAIPGVHTDAQLFEWITNGFPGSRMPAFKTTLSDTDRWNLVNYIRTLAPK